MSLILNHDIQCLHPLTLPYHPPRVAICCEVFTSSGFLRWRELRIYHDPSKVYCNQIRKNGYKKLCKNSMLSGVYVAHANSLDFFGTRYHDLSSLNINSIFQFVGGEKIDSKEFKDKFISNLDLIGL